MAPWRVTLCQSKQPRKPCDYPVQEFIERIQRKSAASQIGSIAFHEAASYTLLVTTDPGMDHRRPGRTSVIGSSLHCLQRVKEERGPQGTMTVLTEGCASQISNGVTVVSSQR